MKLTVVTDGLGGRSVHNNTAAMAALVGWLSERGTSVAYSVQQNSFGTEPSTVFTLITRPTVYKITYKNVA